MLSAPNVLIVATADWYFMTQHMPVALALRDSGFNITVAAPEERRLSRRISRAGIRFIPLKNLRRRSNSPFDALDSIAELRALYREEKPDLIHHHGVKPVVFGGTAARFSTQTPVINTLPSLSFLAHRGFFIGFWRAIATRWMRYPLGGPRTLNVFQNPDNYDYFIRRGAVDEETSLVIRGPVINARKYYPAEEPSDPPVVVIPSRLLWGKGVSEFVAAARLIRERDIPARFVVLGDVANGNGSSKSTISAATLKQWEDSGLIERRPVRGDLPVALRQSSIITFLNPHREGAVRPLLEAAATGRPIVAVDSPGAREVITNGENGFLVPENNALALASALADLLSDRGRRTQMGFQNRQLIQNEFSVERIVDDNLAIYQEMLTPEEQLTQFAPEEETHDPFAAPPLDIDQPLPLQPIEDVDEDEDFPLIPRL